MGQVRKNTLMMTVFVELPNLTTSNIFGSARSGSPAGTWESWKAVLGPEFSAEWYNVLTDIFMHHYAKWTKGWLKEHLASRTKPSKACINLIWSRSIHLQISPCRFLSGHHLITIIIVYVRYVCIMHHTRGTKREIYSIHIIVYKMVPRCFCLMYALWR